MPDWPAPPLGAYLFLENPWPVMAIASVVALMAAFYALRYRKGWLWAAAGLFALAAGGVGVLAMMVESAREAMTRRTTVLVQTTLPPLDAAGLNDILAEQVTLYVAGVEARNSRSDIIDQADRVQRTMEFPAWSIQAVDARRTGDGEGQSALRLSTTLRKPGDPTMALMGDATFTTTWRFDWRRDEPGRWRLTRIEWLKIGDRSPSDSMLP